MWNENNICMKAVIWAMIFRGTEKKSFMGLERHKGELFIFIFEWTILLGNNSHLRKSRMSHSTEVSHKDYFNYFKKYLIISVQLCKVQWHYGIKFASDSEIWLRMGAMGENCIMCVRKERDWYWKLKISTACFRVWQTLSKVLQSLTRRERGERAVWAERQMEGVWWNERCPRC